MSDKELNIKASPKDIAKRLQSIKTVEKLALRTFAEKLSSTTLGYKINHNTVKLIIDGEVEPNMSFLVPLALVFNYSPTWVLTGLGEKKITKEASRIVTDIQVFRIELEAERAWRIKAQAEINQLYKRVEYLERELKIG